MTSGWSCSIVIARARLVLEWDCEQTVRAGGGVSEAVGAQIDLLPSACDRRRRSQQPPVRGFRPPSSTRRLDTVTSPSTPRQRPVCPASDGAQRYALCASSTSESGTRVPYFCTSSMQNWIHATGRRSRQVAQTSRSTGKLRAPGRVLHAFTISSSGAGIHGSTGSHGNAGALRKAAAERRLRARGARQ